MGKMRGATAALHECVSCLRGVHATDLHARWNTPVQKGETGERGTNTPHVTLLSAEKTFKGLHGSQAGLLAACLCHQELLN